MNTETEQKVENLTISKPEASSQPASSADKKPGTGTSHFKFEITNRHLLFLIYFLSIFLGLFGYLQINNVCYYKGVFAREGACVPVALAPLVIENDPGVVVLEDEEDYPIIKDFKLSEDGNLKFQYPNNWVLKNEDGVIFVYSSDPSKISTGVNDNISISEQNFSKTEIDLEECKSYANSVIENSKKDLDKIKLTATEVEKINGYSTCEVMFESSINGVSLEQQQYLILSNVEGKKSYIATVTLAKGSKNVKLTNQIINSFYIK